MRPPEPPAPRSVVVVGAGLAAARTAAALRAHGFDGPLTVLGDEGVPPYDRPPLSKELLTRGSPAWVSDEIGVDVAALADARLDDPATDVRVGDDDVAVTTRSGAHLRADALVLATGARPVRPAGWGSALTLHTAADADRLRAALRPGARLVVVGAGWVGAEVAGVAAGAGVDVTVLEAGPAPLARQLGPAVGRHLAPWYARAGVTLRTDAAVAGVDDRGCVLAGGERLDADVVLAAVGARPATHLLGTAGGSTAGVALDARGGVVVDGTGRAGPRVWAVGDCATRRHPVLGEVPGGHWSAALHDPDATARAMLGLEAPAPRAPYVFSRQLGHDLALLGLPDERCEVHLRGRPEDEGAWAALYVEPPTAGASPARDGDGRTARLRAVLLVDGPREVGGVRRLMDRPVPLDVDLARACDPAWRWRDVVA
ncbi:NAD(P)/FAD-dependent oxidoreductase [Cellulomonas sp. PhB143]|uniref:NAD(P)/FAD-dependent oxidoreductase n=1 Tax=Cellulomonas sp. PhB143 TaxID=2485186 RepID=UPI000F4678DF|nr:FAD-dependent oxidoreductase [Cellulomonas sp. PhB143]ROS79037.1 pyridine nucleotide-disulfide oxidoreductase [Cellulomonas sp. PhB143]